MWLTARVMGKANKKTLIPSWDERLVRGATQLRLPLTKKPVDDATGKGQPHSLLGYGRIPAHTFHPDNGGVSD